MSDSAESTTHEKGQRHEREAKDILKAVYGSGVEKVDAYSNSDPFGFVDLIAMQADEQVLFVQVKTNRFTAKDRRKYRSRTSVLPHEHAEFEVWVRVDQQGWELYEFDGEDFELYETLPCNRSEARSLYREVTALDD